ncbi:hypothetical protein BU17DRAFT_52517 [Hysterangium stoloniferum]|nr:hypothetical protein BU17DRAFT_52517 [Hysterangium stoloniferum]
MGRTKTKKPVRSSTAAQKAETSTATTREAPSTISLFEKAQELVVQCNYDLARKFLLRVLEQEPSLGSARELLGEVQLEMGELDTAKETFNSLLPPSPYAPITPSSSAHLNLAQLADDPQEALKHYQVATDILIAQLKGKDRAVTDVDVEAEVKTKAVGALVAMVEIWMSDLCFEDEAEATCDKLATLALEIDPTSPEALQTLASIRMSQKRTDDAQQCAERAWERWRDLDPDSPSMPSLPVRMSLARLFLELSLYSNALAILSGVLAVDDQEVEAWYLEGWAFYLMAEYSREISAPVAELSWEELSRDAMDCLETCQTLHQSQGHPDEQILQHATEIIAELSAAGVKPSPEEEVLEDTGDGDNDAWEDEDEDGDGDVEMQ